jgi:hypothetical protein
MHSIAYRLAFIAWVFVMGCGTPSDSDRTAALWVLSTDGHVEIEVEGKQWKVSTGSKLPSRSFIVRSIAWEVYPGDRNSRVSDADLHLLTELLGLQRLDLWATEITDAGVESLVKIMTLERLQLSQTQITDAGLSKLKALTNLRELAVVGSAVTEVGVRRFQRERSDCRLIAGDVGR